MGHTSGAVRATDANNQSEQLVDGGLGTLGQTQIDRELIALRAYELWKERGCPLGSPEKDWFQAEAEFTEAPSLTAASHSA